MEKNAHPLKNPFIYEGYAGPNYFCDRTEETEKVIAHLQNGRNVTLVSPRKIGKTGLIQHVFHQIKAQNKNAICIYTDIFHTQNQHDLVQTLGRAILQESLTDVHSKMEKVLNLFSSWRPTLSIDPMTGTPTVSVSIEPTHPEYTLKSIFDHLEQIGKEVYVAIDEFQTITDYPETGTEALLRSHIQFLHNTHFIFSGSKQHLMYEIFGSPKRPFFQSTEMMSLFPLHEEIYYAFASHHFKDKNGEITEAVFHNLYQQFDGYTWYVQSVLNRLYEYETRVTDTQQVNNAILNILRDRANQYETFLLFLTNNQVKLLKAIAQENIVPQPLGNAFILQHSLSGTSSIKKALNMLKEKDLVYQTPNGYIIYDRFFNLWLQRTF